MYNSESSLADGVDTSHFMVAGIALTAISINDERRTSVYIDKRVQSSNSERPIILAPGRETREFLAETLQEIEEGCKELTENNLSITFKESDGSSLSKCTKVEIDISQLDGKAISVGLGLGGSYCTGCTVSEEGKNPDRIREYFKFDRSVQNIHQIFEDLVETDEFGNEYLPKNQGDYSTRTGITHQPLTKTIDLCKNIPITHAYIRSLNYFENLAYRINSDVLKMGKGKRLSTEEKSKLEGAKKQFRFEAKKDLHLQLDQPDPCGSGGSSDTAAVARTFFSFKKRQDVLKLFHGNSEQNSAIDTLLRNFSVILRIISSKERQIDTDSFEDFSIETYCLLAESFPWASIPISIHRLLGHSAEKIRLNSDTGLGKFSEEGLESLHKLVRRFREHCARKTSLEDNIRDTFMHLWVRSDPIVRSYARVLSCSHCNESGHSKRSCDKLRQVELSTDDLLFEAFFIQA